MVPPSEIKRQGNESLRVLFSQIGCESGVKLHTGFAMFPYPVINCQGLSNLLGLLAVRLNELETALIYNNKIKRILK